MGTVEQGVGECPDRLPGLGHVWVSWKVDDRKPCVFCGRPGRDNRMRFDKEGERESGGFFAEATADRSALIGSMVRAPESAHGKVKKS